MFHVRAFARRSLQLSMQSLRSSRSSRSLFLLRAAHYYSMLRHRCFKTISFCVKNGIKATRPRHLPGISLPTVSHWKRASIRARRICPTLVLPPKVGTPTSLSVGIHFQKNHCRRCQRPGSRQVADRVALPSILLPTQDCSTQSCVDNRIESCFDNRIPPSILRWQQDCVSRKTAGATRSRRPASRLRIWEVTEKDKWGRSSFSPRSTHA